MPPRLLHTSRNEQGSTATEYGLLALFIAVVIAIGIQAFGVSLNGLYQGLATTVNGYLP
jgi:Flp pilus assembly pilin Flp